MNDGRIKIIHQGHIFVTFTDSFTDKLNIFGDIAIEKIVLLIV